MNEIEILCASDDHSNIIRLHGFEHDQDFLYICLERWTCNLDDLIRLTMRKFSKSPKAVAPLDSWEEAMEKFNFWKAVGNPLPLMLKLLRDIVSGLAHMHELKIVHRDLKPQNVLILAKGTNLTAKISDFVISKRLNEDSSSTDDQPTCHGSPGWQAPEQLRKNDANEAVDMFRFGCILCYAITGSHPFGDSHRDTNILNNNQVNLSHVKHPEASILIYQLLNPKPNLR
ncbi:hypothetical protein ARALYDRAFT_892927 [Arabidopsis lyrata subsp. lyrata]|uniref:Protein kinase domain-containing protein n=1 Tax=Arabidopsis lyrata subsp. lyrata TaxID=81972 RepID=D7KS62_ARALL|nr:hypothetical protein ARALYDRAFT_892927 [Arabidopsis lyrata subsp. lyrata]